MLLLMAKVVYKHLMSSGRFFIIDPVFIRAKRVRERLNDFLSQKNRAGTTAIPLRPCHRYEEEA